MPPDHVLYDRDWSASVLIARLYPSAELREWVTENLPQAYFRQYDEPWSDELAHGDHSIGELRLCGLSDADRILVLMRWDI